MKNVIDMSGNAITRFLLLLLLLLALSSAQSVLDGGLMDRQRPMDCFVANETCFNAPDSQCRNSLLLMYHICGRSWKYCDSDTVKFCRSHIVVVRSDTVFKGCVCYDKTPRYRQCDSLWKLLNQNPCEKEPVPRRPAGAKKSDLVVDQSGFTTETRAPKEKTKKIEKAKKLPETETIKQQLEKVGVKPDTGEGPSCLMVMKNCEARPRCEALRSDFVNDCQFTACERNSDACLYTYENIRVYSVFKCTCLGIPKSSTAEFQACHNFRAQFVENKCLALMNSQTLYGFNVNKKSGQTGGKVAPDKAQDRTKAEPRPPQRLTPDNSAVSKPKPKMKKAQPENCFNIYSECVRSLTCLIRLINISENCINGRSRGTQCRDRQKCLDSLTEFYTYSTTGSLAVRAMVCDCSPSDRDCLAKRSLFRPVCAYEEQSTTCLSMLEECYENPNCKPRYGLFYDYCNKEGTGCKNSPEKCLDAYRTLWGTSLTQRCSCRKSLVPLKYRDRGQINRYLNVCRRLQRMFTRPPCLKGKYDVAPKTNNYIPAGYVKGAVEQRRRDACRNRLETGVREATIRLYHNDSCSDLCQCTHLGEVRCRVLPCTDARPCRGTSSDKCKCVFGEEICPPSSLPVLLEHSPPGIYFHVGFSPSERRVLRRENPAGGVDFANLSRDLTWVLNTTTGGASRLCQLQLESQSSSSALYRVRLVERRLSDSRPAPSVADACRYPIRLLKLMIDAGDPAIRTHPHLSLMRQARLLDSSSTPDVATAYQEIRPNGRRRLPSPERTHVNSVNHNAASISGASQVGVLLLVCLAWRR